MRSLDRVEEQFRLALEKDRIAAAKEKSVFNEQEGLASSMVVSSESITYKTYRYLGGLYNERGRYKDAEAHFSAAIQLEPNRTEGYFDIGMFYYRRGKIAAARKNFLCYLELGGRKQEEALKIIKALDD